MPFLLTASYRRPSEKRRMFPKELAVFELHDGPESWRQLKQLMYSAILRIFLRPRNREPSEFTFYGRRPTQFGRIKVLEVTCTYNPLSKEIKVTRAKFDDNDEAMQELKREFYYVELGKIAPMRRRTRRIRTELSNPLEGRTQAPEPPVNEYGSPMDAHEFFFHEPRTTAPQEPRMQRPE